MRAIMFIAKLVATVNVVPSGIRAVVMMDTEIHIKIPSTVDSTERPYGDRDDVTLLCAHPVDELTCEKTADSIEDGEAFGASLWCCLFSHGTRDDALYECATTYNKCHDGDNAVL